MKGANLLWKLVHISVSYRHELVSVQELFASDLARHFVEAYEPQVRLPTRDPSCQWLLLSLLMLLFLVGGLEMVNEAADAQGFIRGIHNTWCRSEAFRSMGRRPLPTAQSLELLRVL